MILITILILSLILYNSITNINEKQLYHYQIFCNCLILLSRIKIREEKLSN